ncbi:vWA domain-containing protein [Planktosalinus lacus]|uniref:BatB protein n=1 Tax=Planktosalinus lacus TaxID=1526573 RepID=A0A8J2V436_9FLAO|nr:VWA domain-containing protein [Planktosalinus lacus]GGD81215.1 BatB protein [Planktosalinus lacus]
MYQLEASYYLYLLGIIPLVLLAFLMLYFWKRKAQKQFAEQEALLKLSPAYSRFKSVLKLVVFSFAFILLIIAIVNPRVGTQMEEIKREGVDVVFAMDVSKSMLSEDIAPNRLEKSKQLVSQLLNALGGDRVGIIGYAGAAFPQLPITTDYNAARMFLNSMNTDMVSSQGTAIGEAIELSKTYYDNENQTSRVLIIISDGEDHQGNIENAINEASELGIKVITIGVGTPAGGPIPIKRNGVLQEYYRDKNGDRVITKMDDVVLKQIAQTTDGLFLYGDSTTEVVDGVKDYLNKLDKEEFETMQFSAFKSQYQWFLAGALLLFFLDIFLLERKTFWLEKLNLFNEKTK